MKDNFGYEEKNNEYEVYKKSGKPIRVTIGSENYLGYLNEINENFLNLIPSLVYENFPNENGKTKFYARLEKKIPIRIPLIALVIEPLSSGYLEKLIKSINKVKPVKGLNQKNPTNQNS